MSPEGRDGIEVDALRTDRYLESLLAAHDRHADDAPAGAELDPAVRDAARRLGRDLLRVHPSFRFEERLAARLAEVAAQLRLAAAAGAEGTVVPFAGRDAAVPGAPVLGGGLLDLGDPLAHPLGADPAADPLVARDPAAPHLARPLLIGGALTSAALSLAGAAWVAWRRTRPPLSPMARAVRVARQARLGLRPPPAPIRRRLD